MRVKIIYGGGCPDETYRVSPSCRIRPQTISPEWLISHALYSDGYIRNWQRLSFLLKTVHGPYTVSKAAAVEPDDWMQLHWLSRYTDGEPRGECACLLPFAPNTSALSSLGKKRVCIEADKMDRKFLETLVYALAATGTEELALVNPPTIWQFGEAVYKGQIGAYQASIMRTPRPLQVRVKETLDIDLVKQTLKQDSEVKSAVPTPRAPPDLLKEAFDDLYDLAAMILEELQESGYIMSLKAYIEGARQLDENHGIKAAMRLILYGYARTRQGQVEPTDKAVHFFMEA